MRIAIIGNSSDTLILFRLDLIKDLLVGNDVYVISPHFKSDHLELFRSLGVTTYKSSFSRFGINPIKELLGVITLSNFLKQNKIDIVFGYFIKPSIYSLFAGKIAGISRIVVLIEGLGFFFTYKKLNFKSFIISNVLKMLFKFSLPFANKIIYLNKDDKTEVSQIVSVETSNHILGGIGVDLKYFGQKELPELNNLIFLFVGRILVEKGIWEFVESAKITIKKHPMASFWIVGGTDGNPGSISSELLQSAIRGSGIEWFGDQKDVRPFLEKCHVFVLPSYREGLPRSTQEAMSTGRAIITTNVPGCRDTVINDINGLIVEARSVNSLVLAFEKIILSPDCIKIMGRESRRISERDYDAGTQNKVLADHILGKEFSS